MEHCKEEITRPIFFSLPINPDKIDCVNRQKNRRKQDYDGSRETEADYNRINKGRLSIVDFNLFYAPES